MFSLKSLIYSMILPVLVSSVDLEALLNSSEDPTDVACRYLFFLYVATFLVAVIAAQVYATINRPEKRQYTYSLNPPSINSDRDYD